MTEFQSRPLGLVNPLKVELKWSCEFGVAEFQSRPIGLVNPLKVEL